ncbi:MAG: hypothetical protein CMI36_16075 [Owenweeksia sp.]|nr:hypothetical protein [Owenweeksia sp.]MBG00508.1 hypothetical protein [Owenweeksia sp.]HCQ17100.1 hypothetical protein [Cryomorphaceae bacterium]|tara:strand:- start:14628 stop:15644 length:1017 start_codon:yes stop_codon:yes gene_type:complete
MKKNLIYLLVFIVLLVVAGWLLTRNNREGTLGLEGNERYAFAIKDTGDVDKIIIKDKTPSEIILKRDDHHWTVNGSGRAREDAIEILLETLYRMEMRNFIPERMQPTVIKRMAVRGKEVQIYKNGKLAKTFYVGTEAHDEMATYMLIKGSDQPFAVHIPGFNGFLSTRFFTQEHLWRSRTIVSARPGIIRSIEMTYPDSSSQSFELNVFSPDSVYIKSLQSGEVMRNRDRVKTNLFLNSFRNLTYEGLIIPSDPIYSRKDSLLASNPVFRLKLTDIDGKVTTLSGYRIKGPEESLNPELEPQQFDPDRLHGFINDDKMVLLQYFGLNPILKPKDYFLK